MTHDAGFDLRAVLRFQHQRNHAAFGEVNVFDIFAVFVQGVALMQQDAAAEMSGCYLCGAICRESGADNHPVPAKQVPELLGTTENELGIRKWLEDQGHTLVTTSDKEGENSTFDKELVDAEIIITTPYVL